MKCGVVGNPAYNCPSSRLYNLENYPLYEMRIKSNDHTRQKQQLVLVCMRMWQCGFVGKRE